MTLFSSVTRSARGVALPTSLWILIALTGLGTSPAWAMSDEEAREAKQHFEEAKRLYAEEAYLEAAHAFREAYEISERSELLYNIARSYQKAERLQQAEVYYQKYLDEMPDAPNADQVVETIIDIQEEMAATMAQVEVESSPEGIAIYVDQEPEPRCETPCTVSLMSGEHVIEARSDRAGSAYKRVDVEVDETETIKLALPGHLAITTDLRGGTVEVGQESWDIPLEAPIMLPAGEHDVRLKGGGSHWSGRIEIEGGEETRMHIPLAASGSKDRPGWRRDVSYGLLGASAGVLTGAALFGSQAAQTHEQAEEQQSALGGVDPYTLDRGQQSQKTANTMFAMGAGTLATGVGLLTWDLLSGGKDQQEDEIGPTRFPDAEEPLRSKLLDERGPDEDEAEEAKSKEGETDDSEEKDSDEIDREVEDDLEGVDLF
ncbi:MAG: PEGA domain-containing protein [Persicimonas sp.]